MDKLSLKRNTISSCMVDITETPYKENLAKCVALEKEYEELEKQTKVARDKWREMKQFVSTFPDDLDWLQQEVRLILKNNTHLYMYAKLDKKGEIIDPVKEIKIEKKRSAMYELDYDVEDNYTLFVTVKVDISDEYILKEAAFTYNEVLTTTEITKSLSKAFNNILHPFIKSALYLKITVISDSL